MADLETLGKLVTKLPAVMETTHFNLPAFRVAEKIFAVVQKDKQHVFLFVTEKVVNEWIEKDPQHYLPVRRLGKVIGLEINLEQFSPEDLQCLVTLAWESKA